MDPRTFNINSANELRLRRHVREVLLPYARVHLTSDHVAFTEKAVEELLLQMLEYVPMADATSIFLPTEPFEHLMRSLDSVDFTPLQERWSTPLGHVAYLRNLFPPLNPRDLQTEKCWHKEDNYMKLSLMCKPVSSPILSRRAVRETPKPGSTDYRASIPRSNSSLTAYLGLDIVPVQSIEDLPTPPIDDVLDLRFKFDHATGSRARPLLQSVLLPSMKGKFIDRFEDTPNVPEFLNHQSPPQRLPSLDSPPLFPRVVRRCSTHGGIRSDTNSGISNPTCFPDLISMVQDASSELIDSEDGDINGHHMKAVSGWSTLTFSSPPPRSPCSLDGSGVDELWNISPSGTPATSLMAVKMDDVEIPRIRKFGHKNPSADERADTSDNTDLLTAAKCPGFFITSFISAPIPMAQAHVSITPQLEGVKSGMHPPHLLSPGQDTSDSLLGQPASIFEEQTNKKTSAAFANFVEDFGGQRFDDAVASIYVSTPQDPLFYIREEKLDDKDIMLMDVPNLPPPTAHPREPTLFPKGMRTFVTPTNKLGRPDAATLGTGGLCLTSFLRLVKGIKPLALDLSWRPFNFGKTIPTDEDVIGIAKYIQPEDEVPGYLDEKYKGRIQILLDLVIPPTSAEEALIRSIPRGCEEFGTSPTPKRTEETDRTMHLLTHRERLRASSAKILFDTDNQVQDDSDTGQHIAQWSHDDGHQDVPRQDQCLPQYKEHQSPRNSFGLTEYYRSTFDDSGIDIMDSNVGRSTSGLSAPHLPGSLQVDSLCDANALLGGTANQGEDKENVLPPYVGDYQLAGNQPDSPEKQYDWSCYFEFPASETPPFEPLSFASQCQFPESSDGFTNSKVQDMLAPTLNDDRVKRLNDDFVSTGGHDGAHSRLSKRRKLSDLVSASPRDLFSTFIGLRNQVASSTVQDFENRNDGPTPYQTPDTPNQIAPRAAPDDIFNQRTVHLPEHWIPAAVLHRYLVSMNVIQKRSLVRELQGHHCRVTLVERCDLGGTDIIIDPDFGVLFVPLLALPANIESTVERISGESWRYSNLLAVFEAFPSAHSYRADRLQVTGLTPYAYTPPICKAIKKLRRTLGIAEGCGTMNPDCTVTWAFANDVEEVARFVRCFGEEACTVSIERGYGPRWDDREWLEEEEREGESILASVHGMNAFAAFVMLYNKSLDAILDLSPEDRVAEFGHLLGKERMIGLNAVIENRVQQIAPDTADSIVDPGH